MKAAGATKLGAAETLETPYLDISKDTGKAVGDDAALVERGPKALRTYPCGSYRPLARGWLHAGVAALGWLVLCYMVLTRDPRRELMLMVLAKTVSLAASANLHVKFHETASSYAAANALDFALLPFNEGCVLAVATPRSWPWLRALHCAVLTSCAASLVGPVHRWTHCVCAGDVPGAAIQHRRRTAILVLGATWILVAWLLQAWPLVWWAAHVFFVLLGFFCYSSQYLGMPSLPWHGEWWGAHDDFHACGLVADAFQFAYAVPAASAMVAI